MGSVLSFTMVFRSRSFTTLFCLSRPCSAWSVQTHINSATSECILDLVLKWICSDNVFMRCLVVHDACPVVLSVSFLFLQSCKDMGVGCQMQMLLLFLTRSPEVQLRETHPGIRDSMQEELCLHGLAQRRILTGEVQVTSRQFMETGGWRMTTGSAGQPPQAMKARNLKVRSGARRRGQHLFWHPLRQPPNQFYFSGALLTSLEPSRQIPESH